MSFLNHHLKLSTVFILKMCFLKNSALASFIVLSVIVATLFITAKQCHFYVKAAKYMGISHLKNKRLKNVKQSAISDHMLICVCNIKFNDFTILSKDSKNINSLIKESLLIARDKPILNKAVKSFSLKLFE